MEDIQYEAILGMMSEMNRKLDTIQANSKMKDHQPVNQTVSIEEIEPIIKKYATAISKYIEVKHNEQTEHHNKLLAAIKDVKKQIETIPQPKKVSLESLAKLFPQPKKVIICGFEFLRTSVAIGILIAISFFSLVLNIKQMDDYRALKSKYREHGVIQQVDKRDEKPQK
jgi:hypothetical protein